MLITYLHSTCPEDQIRVQSRCRNFADAINRTGTHSANLLDLDAFLRNTPAAQKVCAASDLLVIHRHLYGSILTAVQYWKAYDKKIIVDFDQAVNYLTSDMPGYEFWRHGSIFEGCLPGKKSEADFIQPSPLEQFKWGLGLVDGAIVSSARLANDWSSFTVVQEIPDCLNPDHYPAVRHNHANEIWIGLGNSTTIPGFKNSGLLPALENICRAYPQVRLVLGNSNGLQDQQMAIPSGQISRYNNTSFEESVIMLLKLDIGIAPNCGDYDMRKGSIDLLEFMVSKIPWLASEHGSYPELSQFGICVPNSPQAWESAILKAIDQLDANRKKAVGEPFLFALSQNVQNSAAKVLKFFTKVINQN